MRPDFHHPRRLRAFDDTLAEWRQSNLGKQCQDIDFHGRQVDVNPQATTTQYQGQFMKLE
jgi:hypothetical protein